MTDAVEEARLAVASAGLPPVVAAWVGQLLDPALIALVGGWPAERVDVRLSASRGRVRRLPEVVLNGGAMDAVRADG